MYILSYCHTMVGLTPEPSSMLTPCCINCVPLRHKLVALSSAKASLVQTQFIETL